MPDVAEEVKRRRPYRSERRRRQAEQTREEVLAAAAELFLERGYEGASVAGIAARAGVSPETVYARFHNKRALLGELVRRAVRGDDPAPVLEQEGPREVWAATDQHEQLRLFAADVVLRLERAGPMVAVLAAASPGDPELASLLARLHGERLRNLRRLVDGLAREGPLKLDRDQATDVVWALASPDVHRLLTGVRGWSRRRYCEWLADQLAAALLGARG